MCDDPAEELKRLFIEERRALLRGDLAGIETFGSHKEDLFRRIARGAITPARLAELKSLSEANGELLAAAARGLKSAMRRVCAIRSANGPLSTYASDGQRVLLGADNRRLERRA